MGGVLWRCGYLASDGMSAPKWTKEPWTLRLVKAAGHLPAHGFLIAAEGKHHSVAAMNAYEDTAAICGEWAPPDIASGFYTPEEIEANARLLAAAPALYAALGDMLAYIESGCAPSAEPDLRLARAALAAARGETP